MFNNFNIAERNSFVFEEKCRLAGKNGQLSYQTKKRRRPLRTAGDMLGVTKTSLHQVVKAATIQSKAQMQEIVSSSETVSDKENKLSNIKYNLKQIEAIRTKSSKKKIFKLFPSFFHCASTQSTIEEVKKHKNLLEENGYESYVSSEEETYYSCEEEEVDPMDVPLVEQNQMKEEIQEETAEEFHLVPLNENDPYAQAIDAMMLYAGPEATTLVQALLPKDVKSWDLQGNAFTLEFSQAHRGTLKGVSFNVTKIVTGNFDSQNHQIHFDEGCISGTYLISGSLFNIQALPSESRISVTGGKTVNLGFTKKTISKTLQAPLSITLDLVGDLKWS